jgi:crotonobetainyl-CoA:carnitine CoA-transferase CaiB-like acyl-CoA transferase
MSIADIAADPQYQARGMIASVPDARLPDGQVTQPGVIPTLSGTPGAISWSGGALGADNACVYGDLLGLSAEEIARLASEGII